MEHGDALRLTVRRVTRVVRLRRVVFYGLRGLAWGFGCAVLPMLLRSALGPVAVPVAAGLVIGALLVGSVYGLLLRVPAADAARVADRTFALHDRLGTAVELLGTREPTGLAAAAIHDAAERAAGVDARRAVPWRWPPEGRWLPVPVLVLLVLPYLPPLPLSEDLMPRLTPGTDEEQTATKAEAPQVADRPAVKRPKPPQRVPLPERDYAQPQDAASEHPEGDLSAVFKDTIVAQKRPDFTSFLKLGDDRLRMLERVDSLPDLQSDFTQSPYKMLFQKSRELLAGGDPRGPSRQRLRQLLDEMDRIGRPENQDGEGDWGEDVWEGSQALEEGDMSRALEAMERALDKLRAMEEQRQGGRRLDGASRRGPQGRGSGEDEELDAFGDAEGSLPGRGTNPFWQGDPTARLEQDPLDFGVEGQWRRGRPEAYDTNMIGRGAENPSRLPYMSVFGQYRKMMEDALVKENIPFDYRSQVKEYFESLEAP